MPTVRGRQNSKASVVLSGRYQSFPGIVMYVFISFLLCDT